MGRKYTHHKDNTVDDATWERLRKVESQNMPGRARGRTDAVPKGYWKALVAQNDDSLAGDKRRN